jgi:4-hydroxybenzoate polyprenyltransferase
MRRETTLWCHGAMPNPWRSGVRTAIALAASCHPIPTVGVTLLVTVLAAVAGNRGLTVALIALAVLTGQVSIGWSNDLIDADRDTAVHRSDKPLARADGVLSSRAVAVATAVATVATVPLSLALGWRAGGVHLLAVASGWVYNLGVKATALSVLPFAVTFGLFPAVATLPLEQHPWPPPWVLLAGALIGVSAHFGNVVPDLDEDATAGVRGLPHRLGRLASGSVACGSALSAIAAVLLGRAAKPAPVDWLLATGAVAVAGVAMLRLRRNRHSEAAFYGSMAIAAIGIALIASSGALV